MNILGAFCYLYTQPTVHDPCLTHLTRKYFPMLEALGIPKNEALYVKKKDTGALIHHIHKTKTAKKGPSFYYYNGNNQNQHSVLEFL